MRLETLTSVKINDADTASNGTLTPYFLEKLQEQRHGDAVSGRLWREVWSLSATQAITMAHIDRTTAGLQTVLALLQASETCRRRCPEDFGIGDDRHEGLVHAARELTHALRVQVDAMGPESD